MTELQKVYVIKNALRDGIRCVELVVETTDFVRVKWPTGHNGERHVDKKDVRFTLEEAQAAVRQAAEKRLKAIDVERRKLARVLRDGVRVREE